MDSAGEAFPAPALATSPPTDLVSVVSFDLYVFPVCFHRKKNWKEFDFLFIYLFGFQADRTDSDGQPPAKRRLSSAVVKVTKKTKHPLFR